MAGTSFASSLRRIVPLVAVYAVVYLLQEKAHSEVNQMWILSSRMPFFLLFLGAPLFGAALLFTPWKRVGGILLLGSMPASFLAHLLSRFYWFTPKLDPVEAAPVWSMTYEISFVVLLLCALLGSWWTFGLIRAIHAGAEK